MFKMIKKLWHKRKAISSIVTAVILIILTITVAAIVYFVIIPLWQNDTELTILDYKLEDTDDSNHADKLTITISNIGEVGVTIDNLTVIRDDIEINWTLNASLYEISPNEQIEIICEATNIIDQLSYGDFVTFSLPYDLSSITINFRISAEFSPFTFLYEENFEDFTSVNWSLNILGTHNPSGNQTLEDWILEEENGNNYWRCTTNNCQYVILNDNDHDFTSVNISYDLRTDDDDANGIIFRYDDSGLYPRFYIIWFTKDHPSPRNGPISDESENFDWYTIFDQIQPDKITVHYVEGDADGFNWYKIMESDWTRNENQWYTWRINANETNMDLFIDNFDIPFMSFSDNRITHGHIGFISFANVNSHYDNIYVW
ncbi:MAG: hypothetical protein FK730_14315 [Asgard group archaeon]|nr:hypothetical protein [Asgard group archaeon]